MAPAAPRPPLLFAGGTVGASCVEVAQRHGVPQRAPRAAAHDRGGARAPDVARETGHTNRDGQHAEGEDGAEQRDHHAVRHDGVEIAGRIHAPERAAIADSRGRGEERREQRGEGERDERRMAADERRERARPGVVLVRREPDLGERPRHVDAELVRRRVLTRVEALAAVVTQVGQVGQIDARERLALLHRRKHRAVLLAVAAGVAHGEDVRAVGDRVSGQHRRRGLRPGVRTRFRSSSRYPRGSLAAGRFRPSPRPPRTDCARGHRA